MPDQHKVCPVEKANGLDNFLRKMIHNPKRILSRYIQPGMTVLDVGCGPGLFAVEIAKMVGDEGKVIAADLQEGMLEKVRKKIAGQSFQKRVIIHKTEKDSICIKDMLDFALAFYVVHEVPSQKNFFKEIISYLKRKRKLFVIEPNFHVSKKEFDETIEIAESVGLKLIKKPKVLMSRSALFEKP